MLYKWTLFLNFCILITHGLEHPPSKQSIVRELADEKINDFKFKLHQALEKLTTVWRSSVEGRLKLSTSSHPAEFKIKEIIRHGCTVNVNGSEIVFVVTARNVLKMLRKFEMTVVAEFPENRVFHSLQAFEYGNSIWLIVHVSERNHLQNITSNPYVEVYEFKDATIVLGQRIRLNGPSIVTTTKTDHEVYTAVATAGVYPELQLFLWKNENQFDLMISTTMENNCSALAIWKMEGTIFVALGFSDTRQLLIKQITENPVRLSDFQLLDVEVYAIKYFSYAENHFLVCGTRNSVIIYWWTGSAFSMDYTETYDDNVNDIVIYIFSQRTIIAVVFNDQVKFLVQTPSARYVSAGNVDLRPMKTVKSVILWEKEALLYALPVFKENHSIPIQAVTLKFEISDLESEPQLKKCVDSLSNHVLERNQELDEISTIAGKTWLKSEEFETTSLKVNGKVLSMRNSTVRSLYAPGISSFLSLHVMAKEMANTIDQLENELKKTFKKTIQFIEDEVIFEDLKVKKATILRMGDHANVNSMNTARLPFALKKRGHQVFDSFKTIDNVLCGAAAVETINGNKVEDYLLLNSSPLYVTGRLEFTNVTVKTMAISSNMINGMNIDNFVLTSKNQTVQGSKQFKNISSEAILREKGVGEVQMDDIKYLISSLDLKTFRSSLKFSSDIIVQGNLNITTLNGNDMVNIYPKFVTKNGEQVIRGKKIFKSLKTIGDMNIRGRINNRLLRNLMTVNTAQRIYGNVTFTNITQFDTILTDSLNGLDLSEQTLVTSRGDKIKGMKTFLRNLTVSNIVMKEGISINAVDPSVSTSEMIYKSNGRNAANVAEFKKDVTVGKIIAENLTLDANSFPLFSELGNVWLRRTEQNISNLKATDMKVNMLNVSKVNGISMEDLITVQGNVDVSGLKKFNNISTKSLNLVKGSNFSFFSLPLDLNAKLKLKNNVTIERAVVEGNLNIDRSENDSKFAFLHPGNFQILKDNFTFGQIEMKNLHLKDLNFKFLNKMNFTEYLERAVVPFRNNSIKNKRFKILKGSEMICNGTLNNVSLQNVATTNTKQEIVSSWKFKKDIFLGSINVTKFFDGIRLEDVVYTDESGNISHKQFNGNVQARHLSTSGSINGVNITLLQLTAFNKNVGNNTISRKIKFHEDIIAQEIKVIRGKIDGLDLKDLILLKESVKLNRMNAASVIALNITVKGLVDRCPWISILQKTSLFRKFPQDITSRIVVKSLVVDGNLNVQYLNGVEVPLWISLLAQLTSSDFDGNVTVEGLKADDIQIRKSMNNVVIDFLLKDAVKKNIYQIIAGKKTFRDIVGRNVAINQMNSSIACGVNTSELFEISVKKNSQNGTLMKTRSLRELMAKRVAVEGRLNDLKIPDDVVILNATEIIEDEVVFNNTINATAGFNVSGNLNDIHFNQFLKTRITLDGSEVIFSTLNFTEDFAVRGNVFVNGTVNNIRMNDIVNKISRNQTVSGTKFFKENMTISDLTVTGSVNGVFPDKILWSSKNESVKNVQFLRLNVSSLSCGTIKGINISEFYVDVHDTVHDVNDNLDEFTADIFTYQDSLRNRKEFVENQLTIFDHFQLHEILDFGKIQRFLPVYEYGMLGEKYQLHVTQMVMWNENEDEDRTTHCITTKSLIADVLQNGTLNVTKNKLGKIFPFSLSVEKDTIVGFYVQAEHSPGCLPGSEEPIVITTMYTSGNVTNKTVVSPKNADLIDVQMLEMDEIFLLMAYNTEEDSERIFVYLYNATDNTWSHHQEFHTRNVSSMDMISIERDTDAFFDPPRVYLSVTGDKNNPGITIYEWDFETDEFYPKSNLSSSVSSYALWFDYHDTVHLLLAKEVSKVWKNTTWTNVYTEPLEVYILEEDELYLNHTVNVKGLRSLEKFIFQEEAFVLASSNHMGTVYVLQLRGYNGFEVVQEIPAPGVTEARVFTVDSHLFLALNSLTEQSRILKASIRGGRLDFD